MLDNSCDGNSDLFSKCVGKSYYRHEAFAMNGLAQIGKNKMSSMLRKIANQMETSKGTQLGRKICMVALVFSLLLGAFGAVFSASLQQLPPIIGLCLFITVLVFSILLAQLFFDLEGWFEQRQRDMDADEIFNALREDDNSVNEPFILYLRPFVSTGKIGAEHTKLVGVHTAAMGSGAMMVSSDRVEFEEEIEKALRPLGKLVALGKPLEHMGAGRIRVDDDVWQDAIKLLIDRAEMIVLLPSPRPGTCWEVEHLLTSGALNKTIVIDPPNDRGSVDDGYDPVSEWQGVKATFEKHGYELPEDDEEGSLIIFGADKQPAYKSKIGLSGENQVRSFAKNLQKNLNKNKMSQAGLEN